MHKERDNAEYLMFFYFVFSKTDLTFTMNLINQHVYLAKSQYSYLNTLMCCSL